MARAVNTAPPRIGTMVGNRCRRIRGSMQIEWSNHLRVDTRSYSLPQLSLLKKHKEMARGPAISTARRPAIGTARCTDPEP